MKRLTDAVFVTGASGLVGRKVLGRLLATRPDRHVFTLVRDPSRWCPPRGTTPIRGDVTLPGLGLDAETRDVLRRRVRLVVHAAADTTFSLPVEEARPVNTAGTARVAELAADCRGLDRFVHVSTAFVAGCRRGRVLEDDDAPSAGFVNGYEQSKHEAEEVLRGGSLPWVVVRPSAIVCDGPHGHVSQYNAVHRALRLYHAGLAPMMPGEESNLVDVVSTDYVADCVALLTRVAGVEGRAFHACSGERALPLGDMLDRTRRVWAESEEWKRRGISMPALTDLETHRLFERTVEETGDERLRAITRSLSHFVPQLAMPKVFDTSGMEDVTGHRPPNPARFWGPMIRYMTGSRWARTARRAA